ncbi:MAG TPA: LacI family DNA-binding transcriptional regulator [Tepidisphaeraceae bacterium]|nr:LacI family DNA-binding transcriptional regulator [Tepidisphaeraceae bacterium]
MAAVPTLIDIAKQTRTSVSTVSRVLAGGTTAERISDQTRGRVLKAARQMGYRPNLLARNPRTRKTNTIALVVSDITNPFFSRIASLIEQALRRHGYSLFLCNSGEDPAIEDEYLTLLAQKGIDGLILVPLLRGKRALAEVLPRDFPLVILDRPIAGISACVLSDHEQATQALCDTLERDGAQDIALICGPQNVYTQRRRAEIVRERFNVIIEHQGPMQTETGRQAFVRFLSHQPQTVICTNNFLAWGFVDSIEQIDDPPVLGVFDEVPLMHLLPLPIVCAMQDIPLLAEGCIQLLLPQLRGEKKKIEPITPSVRLITNRAFRARHGA